MLPRYRMPLYRPPSEAGSLILQVTLGCPHNRCTFCPMYKEVTFRTRPMEEILGEIDGAAEAFSDEVRTIFLADGNTIVLKTERLLAILDRLRERFHSLQRVTCYGSARFVIKKTVQDLVRLREAGLTRIHMGMESGDAQTLERIRKGATPEEMVEAGLRVKQAGMELSEYILVGIAGPERSRAHGEASADLLNRIQPDFLRLRTLVPVEGTPLFEDYEMGVHPLMGPHQCLREIRTLITHLKGPTLLLSDHLSNYADLSGKIPEDKGKLLERIEALLGQDEETFRGSLIGRML